MDDGDVGAVGRTVATLAGGVAAVAKVFRVESRLTALEKARAEATADHAKLRAEVAELRARVEATTAMIVKIHADSNEAVGLLRAMAARSGIPVAEKPTGQ